ncbi:hypothetical protein GCK32_020280 [Trichostrongylus colubriformis]|uniref:Uncharacterized protein n=1 Tax=Trichostrongylus colubriformis TaxID=6319 RepID=A0AAN8F1Y1_TRICO
MTPISHTLSTEQRRLPPSEMSGIICQQTGIAKRQLRIARQEAEIEQADIPRIPNLSDDDLLLEYERHTSAHDSLYRVYSRLDRL